VGSNPTSPEAKETYIKGGKGEYTMIDDISWVDRAVKWYGAGVSTKQAVKLLQELNMSGTVQAHDFANAWGILTDNDNVELKKLYNR
jgi:hypothetical protein